MDLVCACDGLFPLPVEEKAIMESDKRVLACACDGHFPLPVEEKAIMESDKNKLLIDSAMLAMAFPSCLLAS